MSIYGIKDDTTKRAKFKPDGEWHDISGRSRATGSWFTEFPVPTDRDFWIEVTLSSNTDTESCPGFRITAYRVGDGPDDKTGGDDKYITAGRVRNRPGWNAMYHHFLNARPDLTAVRVAVRVWGDTETLLIPTREIKIIPVAKSA